ncbi:unnamed protein product [Auanema sp. JU1783]|nr:unnamed protein product [Auanema sp. JU1783]
MTSPLSTIGVGILGTHVLWEDIETEIQKTLGVTAKFGENKTVKNIGDGIGFLSRICLIHPDWQNNSSELPQTFVVKIISQLPMIEVDGVSAVTLFLEQKSPLLLRVEIDTYNLFNKYGDNSFAIGKMLGHRYLDETNQAKGFFIMEYMGNNKPIGLFDNISIENCREVIKVIAKWQSVSLKQSAEFEKYETHFLSKTYGLDVAFKWCIQTVDGIRDIDHPKIKSMLQKLDEVVHHLCTEENIRKFDELPDKLKIKRVFGHFDLWSSNVLWDRKENGELSLKAIIDYQLGSLTNPIIDFLMFLVCNINADVRRSHTKQFLQDFHGYLSAEMDGQSPFTIEQLEDLYQRLFPIGVLLIYGMVGPTYLSLVEKHPSDSNRLLEVLEKKFIPTLQEVIDVHEQNKEPFN